MPTWSATLPTRALKQGYAETLPDTALRSNVDAGPAKVRQRFTAAVRPITASYRLTRTQAAALDTFYRTTCEGGSLAFDWVHPRTEATVSARFTAPPAFAPGPGVTFDATVQVEVLP